MDQDNLTLIATDAEPQEDALTVKCGGLEGSFGFEHLRYKKNNCIETCGFILWRYQGRSMAVFTSGGDSCGKYFEADSEF